MKSRIFSLTYLLSAITLIESRIPDQIIAPSSCETIDFAKAFSCYQAVLYYGSSIPNGASTFPPYSSLSINETTVPCSVVRKMRDCLSDLKSECYDLPTIYKYVQSGATVEAENFLQLFVNMRLRCEDKKHYDRYTRCRTAWSAADQQYQNAYSNCGDYRYGDQCFAVNGTMTCRWQVMRSVCGDIGGYCVVDKTLMSKQGYISSDCLDDAEDMCKKINSTESRSILLLFLSLLGLFLSR